MLALNCSVIVTTTGVPVGAVSFTGSGGGGGGAASWDGAGAGGGPCIAGVPGAGAAFDAGGAAAEVGEFAGGGAVWEVVPSEFKLWFGAAGGGELLHPPRNRATERAKAVAKGNDFERIGRISISIAIVIDRNPSSQNLLG